MRSTLGRDRRTRRKKSQIENSSAASRNRRILIYTALETSAPCVVERMLAVAVWATQETDVRPALRTAKRLQHLPNSSEKAAVLRPLRSSSMGRRWACSRCRSGPRRRGGSWRPGPTFHNCAECANRRRVIWIWNGNAPKSLCYSAVFLLPGTSTVCCAENYIAETNSDSVIRIGKGNRRKNKCSRWRLSDPAVSAVCCSEDYSLTSVQRSANCDAVIRVSE